MTHTKEPQQQQQIHYNKNKKKKWWWWWCPLGIYTIGITKLQVLVNDLRLGVCRLTSNLTLSNFDTLDKQLSLVKAICYKIQKLMKEKVREERTLFYTPSQQGDGNKINQNYWWLPTNSQYNNFYSPLTFKSQPLTHTHTHTELYSSTVLSLFSFTLSNI